MRLEVSWVFVSQGEWHVSAFYPGEQYPIAGAAGITLGDAVGKAVEEAVRLHVRGAMPMLKNKAGLTQALEENP